jgi:hypothetical protein
MYNAHEKIWGGPDNKTLYVSFRNHWATGSNNDVSINIPSTGKKELWKRVAPADPTGILRIDMVILAPEVNAYCYSYLRDTGNVFLVKGLK